MSLPACFAPTCLPAPPFLGAGCLPAGPQSPSARLRLYSPLDCQPLGDSVPPGVATAGGEPAMLGRRGHVTKRVGSGG